MNEHDELDAAKTDPAIIAKPTLHLSTRCPGPYRGKCLYQSRKCENERAVKRNGKPHNLCDMHRNKQNRHQRKFDAKKFSRKRRRDSGSEDDARIDKLARQELSAQHQLPSKSFEVPPSTLLSLRRNYDVSRAPKVTTLPPIQNLRGTLLPSSPASSYTTPGSVRSEVGSDDYVVPSEFRAVDAPIIRCRQQPRRVHRGPYLQYQVQQPTLGYSSSEYRAAGTLVNTSYLTAPRAISSTTYYRDDVPRAYEPSRQSRISPHVLPSLACPRSEQPNLFRRVSESALSHVERFASLEAISASRSTSANNVLSCMRSSKFARAPMSPSSYYRSR
ncbi:uncharacterized protein PHALS_07254 [Plasmopara halstedii]|uniref:Uncharacterized protein n=1 Tax=Plasmopara halstedii TaxID=4781 RepID=A0A0P1B5M3_PLAHL|nr:uncharacterized protein PHALS_07254 [Plasmopara halstedii]CEG49492.1 hypothetical protein PHALS_07254 [Plasmopara halstedii]|eukprot:XP_024585861.1 hypothetical protein PHALS_07254 [Plasmopara halstedii]